MIPRDYSWLQFNHRVLFEATDPFNPLLERLKFLSIVTSNLEEFFMIRVAVLKRQMQNPSESWEDEDPRTFLKTILKEVRTMIREEYRIFGDLVSQLRMHQICLLLDEAEITPYHERLRSLFQDLLFPLLTPLSVSMTHPFPTLQSGKLYMVIELSPPEDHPLSEKPSLSFLEVPTAPFGRFYEIEPAVFIPVESIVKRFLSLVYPGYTIHHVGVIRITRDADYEHQLDGAMDLISSVEKTIKHSHKREVVKLEVSEGASKRMIKTLCAHLRLAEDFVFTLPHPLNLKDLVGIYQACQRDDLKLKPLVPLLPAPLDRSRDMFSLIAQQDILLFHPYQSYDPVLWLLEAAATDPDVVSIKQTLYRTSSQSEIIRYLTLAAENGKYVSVIDELTARFDEQRNITWARHLQEAGAHVTYGVAHLKTHAKALLIVRKEKDGIRRYVHLATGNYNETTAKLYSDLSLFSAREDLCEDISQMFNLLTGFSLPQSWKRIAIAPLTLRQRILSLIQRETRHARAGLKAEIRAKMNSLSDDQIISALYEASQAGVRITLIVRGICSLIPGIKGLSETITVKSIVGRYLEHSRFYCFYNNGNEEYYLSSADLMKRNLDRRVEILFPIEDKNLQRMIDTIFTLQMQDSANSWILTSRGSYTPPGIRESGHRDSFEEIYAYLQQFSRPPSQRFVFSPLRDEKP